MDILESYNESLEKYGPDDVRSVHWGTEETQQIRFRILMEIADLSKSSVLDYGCGLGDLSELIENYEGFDINPNMIAAARKKYPDKKFVNSNFSPADYVLISSIFNDKLHDDFEAHLQHFKDTVTFCFLNCSKGVAVNALSRFCPHPSPDLWHFDPTEIARWGLEKLTQKITLRHDYKIGNFTMYLFR